MSDPIQFTSGGDSVEAAFFMAANPGVTVLLLHGFPGGGDEVLGLGDRLASEGISVMTFNYRGTGNSGGIYSLVHSQEDIDEAWRLLHTPDYASKYKIDTTRLVLGGYSFGGGMALTFAAGHDDIKRVFSIAGTDHGQFARQYVSDSSFAKTFDTIFKQLQAPEGPVRFVGKDALDELVANAAKYDLRAASPELSKKDLLLIGGLDDPNVTMENHLLPLYRALKSNGAESLRFEVLPDDHSFSHVRERLANLVIDWINNSAPADSTDK